MRTAAKFGLAALLLVASLAGAGCKRDGDKSTGPATGGPAPAGGPRAFLDKKKFIPPRLEWNTDVFSRNGGTFPFRVTSPGPVAITVVTDAGYQALKDKAKRFNKAAVLLTVDSKGPTYDGKVTVPAGRSWFIIENQTDKEAEIHLQCFEP